MSLEMQAFTDGFSMVVFVWSLGFGIAALVNLLRSGGDQTQG